MKAPLLTPLVRMTWSRRLATLWRVLAQFPMRSAMDDSAARWQALSSEVHAANGRGCYVEARASADLALALARHAFGERDSRVVAGLSNLALQCRAQGDHGEAEAIFKEALRLGREAFGEHHPDTSSSLFNLVLLYRIQGRSDEAEALLQGAAKTARSGPLHKRIVVPAPGSSGGSDTGVTTPRTLGRYELRSVVAVATGSASYEAWDPLLARMVALDTTDLPPAKDAGERVARLRQRAEAAGRLRHTGIVAVYEYDEVDGVAHLSSELVGSRTLKTALDERGRLSLAEALPIMADVLAALQHSHMQGVVHRNLKPAKVVLTDDGRARIADFGIAQIDDCEGLEDGIIRGTPSYMAPEQCTVQKVDARADVYAAGVMLYQIVTGKKPFEGDMEAVRQKALCTRPPKPSEFVPEISPGLDAVIGRAMALRPRDRYQMAAAFAQALHAAVQERETAPSRSGNMASTAPPQASPVPCFRREQAKEAVIQRIGATHVESSFVLLDHLTEEWEFGWVFHYVSRLYAKTGDLAYVIPGHGPIIFDRGSGHLTSLGSYLPPEVAVAEYEERWRAQQNQQEDPQPSVTPAVADLRLGQQLAGGAQIVGGPGSQVSYPIPLEARRHGMHVGALYDRTLLHGYAFVLMVQADVPTATLRQHLPSQVKIGAVEHIRELVNSGLSGIVVRALPMAPRQIPFRPNGCYLELDPASPHWRQMEVSGGFAIHLPGDFPNLHMELWAIKH